MSRKNLSKEELEALLSPEKEGQSDDESVGSHSMEQEPMTPMEINISPNDIKSNIALIPLPDPVEFERE